LGGTIGAMKIVDSGYKIDLHIHSISSHGKDKGKVAFNTIDNIPILAEKLNNNGVQMCAITDHDVFDYDMYCALKKYELEEDSTIIKVFPGVEFSVEFQGESGGTVVHVIAIFEDENDEKIKIIPSYLIDENGNVAYDRGQAFSEEKFLGILRSIDLDTVLIAHQKSTLSTAHPYKNDAKTVGEERFKEFVYTDYFEAFEFKNRKNEVFNKSFLNMNNMSDNIRFITGSDCHDWRYYPRETEKDKTDFVYSYVKCIPNFRGLVMAITDHRRIKTVNSFFNPTQMYTKAIDMTIDGVAYTIPLSRGINVIIGDNSIGKSLLLHKITGYKKYQDGQIKKSLVDGYKKYLKTNKIDISTEIPAAEIFAFDMQGEIRDKFEQEKLKSDDFLRPYYPSAIKPDAYKEKVQRKLKKIYDYLEEKFGLDTMEAQLGRFRILDEDVVQAESITFVGSVAKNNKCVEGYNEISSNLNNVVEKIGTIMESQWLDAEDQKQLDSIVKQLDSISVRYLKKKMAREQENKKIALYQAAVNKFKQQYQASVSDSQKKLSTYNENLEVAAESIVELISRRRKNQKPDFSIEKENIEILTERVYDYEFNSRLGITEIDEEYIKNLFSSLMRKNVKKTVIEMSQEELAEAFSGYKESPSDVLAALKEAINEQLEVDFGNKFTITQAGTDRTQELSSGFNSKIYFDILSYETSHVGMYIIDQPEDNVSQESIREYLLDRFKVMGENRQVIIVTHNPQFIVNLDVDNVIYMGREEDKIIIQSGALEYKDENYSILDIVSNHIDGGLDTLKRRWKRYEKNASV
jgi:predicted ATP-dependent endonuclease of OLD family